MIGCFPVAWFQFYRIGLVFLLFDVEHPLVLGEQISGLSIEAMLFIYLCPLGGL